MRDFKPNRIVCLTEETVETLYLLGEQDRVVGVTGYAVRPPEVRKEKVRVGAFTSADIPKILSLNPDLVLTFSDLQADIAAELISKGIDVHAFNQRSIEGILSMISMIGSLVGASKKSEELISGYAEKVVIGKPLKLNNELHELEIDIIQFIKSLKSIFPQIIIERIDERYTSKISSLIIRQSGINQKSRMNKSIIDKISASLILEAYLIKINK